MTSNSPIVAPRAPADAASTGSAHDGSAAPARHRAPEELAPASHSSDDLFHTVAIRADWYRYGRHAAPATDEQLRSVLGLPRAAGGPAPQVRHLRSALPGRSGSTQPEDGDASFPLRPETVGTQPADESSASRERKPEGVLARFRRALGVSDGPDAVAS